MASFHGEVDIIQNWQSIEGNYTNVTANYYAVRDSGSAYSGYTTYADCGLDGTTETKTISSFNLNSSNTKILIGSITKNVYHNSDGTKTVYASFTWNTKNSYSGTISGSATKTLTSIPRQANITRCDNFNSDWNPYMEFNNPGGFTCNLRLEFAGKTITRNGYSGYGGGYTFELSEPERQLLYSACSSSNSLTVRYVVATLINGVETWWSIADRTMTVVNSNPTFSNCTYKDVGDDSTKLTGDNQILINGFNELQVNISTANKAIAKNGATMSRYRLVCGNNTPVEAPYSSTNDVTLTMKNVTDMTFIVYAIDSRGNSTNVTKSVTTWKNYSPIVIKTGSAVRTGGVGTETTLTFEGTLWNDSFGAESNKIVECQYKYKKSNESEYGETIDITPMISDNTFNFGSTIKGDEEAEGFNLSNSFNIQVIVEDEIRTTTYDVLLGSGTPAMAIHPNGVAFGAPYDEKEGGSCQVDGKKIEKVSVVNNLNSTSDIDALSANQGNKLYDMLVKNSKNPIGEFTLWEGNLQYQECGSYAHIGTYYSPINGLLSRYPEKGSPYTRKYKIVLDYTTNNIVNGHMHLKFSRQSDGAKIGEYLFNNIWGGTEDGTRTYGSQDFNVNDLGTGHVKLEISPSNGSGAVVRLYRVYLLIYDELEV